MKRVLKGLIVLLVIWLGFTYYFINQHNVEGKSASINETIVFEDVVIELDRLVLYNFKRKGSNFDQDYETEIKKFKYKVISRIPEPLVMPYLKINYLYSSPYVDNELYQTALFGKCVFTQPFNEPTEQYDYFNDHVSISVVDSHGVGYRGPRMLQDTVNSQEIDFYIGGREVPIERIQEGTKVIIRHLGSGEEKGFEINFQDFITYKHNDSFGKANPFLRFNTIQL